MTLVQSKDQAQDHEHFDAINSKIVTARANITNANKWEMAFLLAYLHLIFAHYKVKVKIMHISIVVNASKIASKNENIIIAIKYEFAYGLSIISEYRFFNLASSTVRIGRF